MVRSRAVAEGAGWAMSRFVAFCRILAFLSYGFGRVRGSGGGGTRIENSSRRLAVGGWTGK